MESKRGLRNPLAEAQVRKAVIALQTFLEKQESEKPKQALVNSTEYLSCIVTRRKIPARPALKPIPIDLPHSLYGGENGGEMCLFVKDDDKDRIKKALAADPLPALAKVMTVKKLRKNFSRFDDKRTLAGAYDMFLADDRILPYLKTPLGGKFFDKKKQPIAVRVSRQDVSSSIRAALQRTAMHVNAGVCTNVRIAHFGMQVEEIVDNILIGMNNCAAHITKGWQGIQSISIKTASSIALPIYNSLSEMAKLPPVASKATLLKKRKLEEDGGDATTAKPKAQKEGKKKTAEAKAPVKSVQPPAKKQKKGTEPKANSKQADVKANAKPAKVTKATAKAEPAKPKKAAAKETPKKETPKKQTPKKASPAESKEETPKAKTPKRKAESVKKDKKSKDTPAAEEEAVPEPSPKKAKHTPKKAAAKEPEVVAEKTKSPARKAKTPKKQEAAADDEVVETPKKKAKRASTSKTTPTSAKKQRSSKK